MITIDDVKKYFEYRKLKWCSDGKDAIDFLITECGELMDSYIRKYRTGFVRNNDKNVNISYELADCYMMLMIASHELTGKSLDENLLDKWKSKGYKPEKTKEFSHYNNPDLPFVGILKDINSAPAIFGFPVATIEKIDVSEENKWWDSLADDEKIIVKEECEDYFI